MKYQLKDLQNRTQTNLSSYAHQIVNGVLAVFPTATVHVHRGYFEITNLSFTTNKLLRAMGKAIAGQSAYLNSLKKTYGNSNQLFVRF